MDATGGRGSSDRLRALLLDDAATAGRINRAEIEAVVRAHQLGIATAPVETWPALHEQISAALDPTSSSVALDAWSRALGTDWRAARPFDTRAPTPTPAPAGPTPTPKPTEDGDRRTWMFVAAIGLIAAIGLGAVIVSMNSGDVVVDTGDGDDETTGETDPGTPGQPETPTPAETTTATPTEEETPRPGSQALLGLAWTPSAPTCEVLEAWSTPLDDDRFVAPAALGAIWCDFIVTDSAIVALQEFDSGNERDAAYQQWLDTTGVVRNSGDCPEYEDGAPVDVESTFRQGEEEAVGRLLCHFDADAGTDGTAYIVWYEDDLPYLGVLVGDRLENAFAAWIRLRFVTDWTPPPVPANDDLADAVPLPASGTVEGSTRSAGAEDGEPAHWAGNGPWATLWWTYEPDADGLLHIDTDGSSIDTLLAVYTGGPGDLTEVASNDDVESEGDDRFSTIDTFVEGGQTYLVAIDGWRGARGGYTLNWSFTSDAAPLLALPWVPDDCVVLPDSLVALPGGVADVDPAADTAVACDLVAGSGAVVGVWLYPDDETRDAAYQRWLDSVPIEREDGPDCSSFDEPSETAFKQGDTEDVGSILCLPYDAMPGVTTTVGDIDASDGLGVVVWYEYAEPYLLVAVAPTLEDAFDWWVDHPIGGSAEWE